MVEGVNFLVVAKEFQTLRISFHLSKVNAVWLWWWNRPMQKCSGTPILPQGAEQ